MDANLIQELIANFLVASIIYVLQTQRLQEKDKIIDRLQTKLDKCEEAEDDTLARLTEFYRVNQMQLPKKQKKEPESADSGSQ